MAEIPLRRPSVRRIGTLMPVWTFAALLGCGAFMLWAFTLTGTAPIRTPLQVPWLLFAVGFAAGHFAGIRFEYKGESHNLDLTDVVLIPAIVFAHPGGVILAAALGTALRSLWVHRPITKAAFNIAIHAFAVAVAFLCYHAFIGHAGVLSAEGWVAAAVAVIVADIITYVGIQAAISLSTRRIVFGRVEQFGLTVILNTIVEGTVGLAAVHLLWTGAGGGVLFILLAAAVGAGYVAYGRLRASHTHLQQLYRFERALAGVIGTEAVITAALGEALVLLNAKIAQLISLSGAELTCYTLRSGTDHLERTSGRHALAELARRRRQPLFGPKVTNDAELAMVVRDSGFRDALAVQLPTDGEADWVLTVAERNGANHLNFVPSDLALAEALAMPTAMALRSSALLDKLHLEVALKEHQASHDGLTDLANRRLFSAELDRALNERAVDEVVGVLLIDLDEFKKLNDSLGHEAGDTVLQIFAERLAATVGDAGTAGRLGGDEFAVFIPHPSSAADVTAIAQAIDAATRAPLTAAGTLVDLRASIGVAIAPFHGADRFVLLRQADLAMYRAKQAGGGVSVQNDRSNELIDRPSLITALRDTINNSGLLLHYQPTVLVATGQVKGVEALCRWTHPLYGAIGPDQFIPVAEATGLIRPLTRWVLETALSQAATWRAAGFDLNMAINLSPQQTNDRDVVVHIRELLERHRLSPSSLTVEITESDAFSNRQNDRAEVLRSLAALGVRVSLDDFGVGSSSLTRLKQLPVDQLKIDKSFTENLTTDPTDHAIVASTITLAHNLGLAVTAEGVETSESYELLRDLGCDAAQGYLLSRPLGAADLTRWLYDVTRPDEKGATSRTPIHVVPRRDEGNSSLSPEDPGRSPEHSTSHMPTHE